MEENITPQTEIKPIVPENPEKAEAAEGKKVVVGIIIATLILGGVVYAGYRSSQKKSEEKVFPAGYPQESTSTTADIVCGQTKPDPTNMWDYYLKCDLFTTQANEKWVDFEDRVFGFSVALPETLEISTYPNGVGVVYGIIPPHQNLLIAIDKAETRSGEFAAMIGKNYVTNYWRQYSGLDGVKNINEFTNRNGVLGFKASYLNAAGKSPGQDVFYENPKKPGDFIHLSSGILHPTVFDEIADSFVFIEAKEATPTAAF